MPSEFHHVIFTRFNMALILSGKKPTKIHDPEWLNFRFQIFRTSCYPSIANQTNQNFTWFVLFDPDSPEWVFDLMRDEFPRATVIKTDGWHHDERLVTINKHVPASDMLLTTGVDSDDCVHRDYIDEIHKAAATYGTGFLNFTNGFTMAGGRFYQISYPCNAFQSLYEKREDADTCIYVQHQLAHTVDKVHEIRMEPMWLQVIHGTNVSNDLYGIRKFKVDSKAFGISPDDSWGTKGFVGVFNEAVFCALRNLSRKTLIKQKLMRMLGRG